MYTPIIKYGFYKEVDKLKYKKMPKKKKKEKKKETKERSDGQV